MRTSRIQDGDADSVRLRTLVAAICGNCWNPLAPLPCS